MLQRQCTTWPSRFAVVVYMPVFDGKLVSEDVNHPEFNGTAVADHLQELNRVHKEHERAGE